MTSRLVAYAVSAVIWALSFMPAILLLWWLGMIELTLPDIAKAVAILIAIAVVFEVLQRVASRILARMRGDGASQTGRR